MSRSCHAAHTLKLRKFMAWERSFEARVHKVREKELRYQKLNYTIEVSNPFLLYCAYSHVHQDVMECNMVC